MAEVEQDFPLFPLGLVALPFEIVELHIFEERYRTMIAECLEQDSEFGIVWLGDDGLRPIGCAVEVEDVLERFEDGRLNIACRGTRPFLVRERVEHLPYPAGTVEWLQDKPEQVDETTLIDALGRRGHAVFAEAGRAVLQIGRSIDSPGLPSANWRLFGELLLLWHLRSHREAQVRGSVAFFDRGLPDVLAFYARKHSLAPPHATRAVEHHRYNPRVFLLEPQAGMYEHNPERTGSYARAVAFHGGLIEWYRRVGYDFMVVPPASVDDRVDFVLAACGLVPE